MMETFRKRLSFVGVCLSLVLAVFFLTVAALTADSRIRFGSMRETDLLLAVAAVMCLPYVSLCLWLITGSVRRSLLYGGGVVLAFSLAVPYVWGF
jgi:hypothetical protein